MSKDFMIGDSEGDVNLVEVIVDVAVDVLVGAEELIAVVVMCGVRSVA
ncbi:MAG: hypothetical protein JAZ03_00990 [Candidatus Thiodiazotropha taylori]|nr:hypothetical protein [Candidatus Thiodiazotropha taylori]MCW4264199.1 hypothetical protein [Candidatus Thiodiazotropha endolucinida]MCG8030747.1 hypothetical protein [Candidatus Thiodiazotropha taylori]MCG8047896.1 hypothetical protein [Candidatus Thiodiazotropha taylori]MCW4332504.1 hypothetical protein [Candidatus Thiodiazotropha endolucinida]